MKARSKEKGMKLLLALCSILFFGMMGLLLIINGVDKQNEENTIELAAAVQSTQVTNANDHVRIEISLEGNKQLLIQNSIGEKINVDYIEGIQKGEMVYFRIEKNMEEQYEAGMVNIVSLRTERDEIFSLNDYNTFIHETVFQARIAGIIAATIFLILALLLIWQLRRYKKKN